MLRTVDDPGVEVAEAQLRAWLAAGDFAHIIAPLHFGSAPINPVALPKYVETTLHWFGVVRANVLDGRPLSPLGVSAWCERVIGLAEAVSAALLSDNGVPATLTVTVRPVQAGEEEA